MRFVRHAGIYRSDVLFLPVSLGRSSAFRSGPSQAIKHAGKIMLCPSFAMSSGRLFLDRVARQQGPSPLDRRSHHKTIATAKKTNYHQTVISLLTGCLSPRAHFNPCIKFIVRFLPSCLAFRNEGNEFFQVAPQ